MIVLIVHAPNSRAKRSSSHIPIYIYIYRQGGLASSYNNLISYIGWLAIYMHLDVIGHGIQVAPGMRLLWMTHLNHLLQSARFSSLFYTSKEQDRTSRLGYRFLRLGLSAHLHPRLASKDPQVAG